MNTLVLIGLALVAAGCVLLAMRFAPRARRQFAATAAQPRTVADLVRLRQEGGSLAEAAPTDAGPRGAAPLAEPAQTRPAPAAAPAAAAPQIAPATPEPPAPEPAAQESPAVFVPPSPCPTPVAGRAQRESAEPPSPALDGDNAPWQRGARMAVGLGGGQPWREPPAPPAPLRVVPAAEALPPEAATEPASPAEAATGSQDVGSEPEEPAAQPQSVWVAPEAVVGRSEPGEAPGQTSVEPAAQGRAAWTEPGAVAESPGSAEPQAAASEAPVEPAAQAVWGVLGAVAEPSRSAEQEGAAPEVPQGASESVEPPAGAQSVWVAPEAVVYSPGSEPVGPEAPVEPAAQAAWGAVGAVAEQASAESVDPEAGTDQPGSEPEEVEPPAATDTDPERRRSRQTPDEKAAEQAAADLALLRTFGFADKALRPNGTAVVAMEGAEEQEAPGESGAAQPVRYRVVRRDGTVVGGATITLLDDRGGDVAAGAADADGRGEVFAPSPGGYVLVSTAAGHQPGAVAITVGGSPTEADVLIARSASVSGFVHGADGPIAGARVTLVQDGEAVDAVDTDAQGAYRIGDIGAGEYGLSVAAPGREPVAALLEVAEEAEVRHDVRLGPAADGGLVEDDAMSGLR